MMKSIERRGDGTMMILVLCNDCRIVGKHNIVLHAAAEVGDLDLCAGCAEKWGYPVAVVMQAAREAAAREQRNKEAKKRAFKSNSAVSPFAD